jgi:hypothetical protein
MSVDFKVLLLCCTQEDQNYIHTQLMDYFRIHQPGAEDYVVFEPISGQGFFCDYIKNLDSPTFIEYVKNISWHNSDYLFLAISSNSDPFEVCISFPDRS